MGMIVSIYRADRQDCTMNGISGSKRNHKGLCIVNVEGPFEPSAEYPAAMLHKHAPFGPDRVMATVVPAYWEAGGWVKDSRWTMFGGNYAATSDSRWSEAVRRITGTEFYGAVPIHDRIEA